MFGHARMLRPTFAHRSARGSPYDGSMILMTRLLLPVLAIAAFVATVSQPAVAAPSVCAASNAVAKREVVVHYWRPDGDYAGWNLWVWNEGAQGRSVPFVAGKEDAVARFDADDGVTRVGFIVRKGEWERKDIDQDRFLDIKPRGRTEVWLAAGQAAIHASAKAIDRSSSFVGAFLDGRQQITLAMSGPLDDKARKAIKVRNEDGGSIVVSSVTADRGGDGRPTFTVKLGKPVRACRPAAARAPAAAAPARAPCGASPPRRCRSGHRGCAARCARRWQEADRAAQDP